MTHTLHRRGTKESLRTDYIVFGITAQQFNGKDSAQVLKKFFDIVSPLHPTNMGDMRQGGMLTVADLPAGVQDNSIVHAVFNDLETLEEAVRRLKTADLGISIVVSSLCDDVAELAKRNNVKLHTQEVSLGIHGNLKKLPAEEFLHVTTQCGHGLIAANLVKSMVEKVKNGKITPRKASEEICKQCSCGVGNINRTEALLKDMAGIA
ncbi:MAG: hypothetical protein LBV80_08395 [Deltaproteobacteria bacterium]|jgi:hypothetical protein|nr:hypothetical protein [Deltaproteobacteria bacterium]